MENRFIARRAALRRRGMEDYQMPEITGPTEGADRASLLFFGVPEGAAAGGMLKAAKSTKDIVRNFRLQTIKDLRPVFSKGMKTMLRQALKKPK